MEWLNELWYSHTKEQYVVIRYKLDLHVGPWRALQNIVGWKKQIVGQNGQ